jgi:HEAT repeat protein
VVKIEARRLTVVLLVIVIGGVFPPATPAQGVQEVRAWPLHEPCRPLAEGRRPADPARLGMRDEAPDRRIAAIASLVGLCHRAGLEAVAGALTDPEAAVRRAAVEALGKMRELRPIRPSATDEEPADPLLEALLRLVRDPDWQVRAELARTLASFQVYQASNTVLNQMANPAGQRILDEHDLRVRCQAILLINQLRDVRFSRKSIGFLALFIDYPEPRLRAIAAETVAELEKTRNGYHELVGIARKPGAPQLRIRAIEWLGGWKRVEIRPWLEELAATEANLRVREAAVRTLLDLAK